MGLSEKPNKRLEESHRAVSGKTSARFCMLLPTAEAVQHLCVAFMRGICLARARLSPCGGHTGTATAGHIVQRAVLGDLLGMPEADNSQRVLFGIHATPGAPAACSERPAIRSMASIHGEPHTASARDGTRDPPRASAARLRRSVELISTELVRLKALPRAQCRPGTADRVRIARRDARGRDPSRDPAPSPL